MRETKLLDTITGLRDDAAGAVVVTGSHGGRISAAYALRVRAAALIVHDAGIGLDAAGLQSLGILDEYGVPCAAAAGSSCLIGDAGDVYRHGRLSHVNDAATLLGLRAGWAVTRAAERLADTAPGIPEPVALAGDQPLPLMITGQTKKIWLIDSAAMVRAEHADSVVVTGSHAELVGGDRAAAIRTAVSAAVFNDGGSRVCARLHALERRSIPAFAVSNRSARIGEARSTWETGRMSVANLLVQRLGVGPGTPANVIVEMLARA